MLIGSIHSTAIAERVHPLFKRVFDYLKSVDLQSLPTGKSSPEGEQFRLIVSEIDGQPAVEVPLETHRKHIDIQLPLQGEETMGWLPARQCLKPQAAYDEASDCTLFDDRPNKYVTLFPGEFIVFFPEDAHAPGIANGKIRKLVVKIPL